MHGPVRFVPDHAIFSENSQGGVGLEGMRLGVRVWMRIPSAAHHPALLLDTEAQSRSSIGDSVSPGALFRFGRDFECRQAGFDLVSPVLQPLRKDQGFAQLRYVFVHGVAR